MNLKYPQWQEPLAAAILEFDPKRFREKAQAAEEAIGVRLGELALSKASQDELRALADRTTLIQGVKRDRVGAALRKEGGSAVGRST